MVGMMKMNMFKSEAIHNYILTPAGPQVKTFFRQHFFGKAVSTDNLSIYAD